MTQYNNVWDDAREYAKTGIYVNPVYVSRKPDGKKDVRPVGLWRQTSSTSLADIGAWEQDHPEAALLIDCGKSKLLVVDCDGQEGIANWLALDPPKPIGLATTAGGGEHWYYREHPDHPIGNDQDGKVAPSVDIRGIGGFVFAPPSTDGQGQWRWAEGPDWTAARYTPDIVIERMKAKSAPVHAGEAAKKLPGADDSDSTDDLFDEPAKRFTREQGVAFIKAERAVLEQKARKITDAGRPGYNGLINNFAMACAHFPWIVDRDRCAALMIKSMQPITGWTEPDRDDRLTINSAYTATESGKSWVATEVEKPDRGDAEGTPAADGDGISGGVLPPPNRPYEVARELVTRMPITSGRPHWSWWRGDFYRWTGSHWNVAEQSVMEHWLYKQTGDAYFLAPIKGKKDDDKVEFERIPWAPTKKRIMDMVHALGVGTLQRFSEEDKALAATNGVIVNRELRDHDPDRFNLWSMPFAYDPAANAPAWDAFLEQVLPGDQEAKDFLAEWFGYVLSGRTDQQKMAALIGEKRSGKGTIARVLTALLGTQNVSGLNLNLMSGTFGVEPLIGKALGVAGDVRWASRNIADAVPILLGVIGEDNITISRKNKGAWHGRLGARFMLMSNETPTFSDKSGALGGRMVFVRFDQSFYGREDTSLTDKLIDELPGILNWALDGLDRLNGRGRFTEPKSGGGEREAQRRLADPIGAFLDDWCDFGADRSIGLDHLYMKYQNWCLDGGRVRDSTTKEIFARDLNKKVPNLRTERARVNGKRVRTLFGVGCDAL